jgi:hypothetical protein
MPHGWVLSLKLVTSLSHVPGQALGLLEHLLLLLQQRKTPSHSDSTYCRGKGAKLDNNAQINRSLSTAARPLMRMCIYGSDCSAYVVLYIEHWAV